MKTLCNRMAWFIILILALTVSTSNAEIKYRLSEFDQVRCKVEYFSAKAGYVSQYKGYTYNEGVQALWNHFAEVKKMENPELRGKMTFAMVDAYGDGYNNAGKWGFEPGSSEYYGAIVSSVSKVCAQYFDDFLFAKSPFP